MKEELMEKLLDRFQEVIEELGIDCMSVSSVYEFAAQLHESGGSYDGFVIVRSSTESGIFYLDTEAMARNENVGPFSFSPKDSFNVEELLKAYEKLRLKEKELN